LDAANNSSSELKDALLCRFLGRQPYLPVYEAMQTFTANRDASTADELWIVEHDPVYTLGQAGKPEHLLLENTGIPLVKIDRGGQITHHGPGQLVIYLLLDLRRRKLFVRDLVFKIEQSLIDVLSEFDLNTTRHEGAPGIYICPGESERLGHLGWDGAKIAALGLKIRNGCSYHGLALNISMNLSPFSWINPCGYEGLKTVDLATLGLNPSTTRITEHLINALSRQLLTP
jgi:lipoyl(octanoyl) transferase